MTSYKNGNLIFRNTPFGGKRKRLDGGGHKILHLDIDKTLAEWIIEMRENKEPVSKGIIRNKAIALFANTQLNVKF